MASDHVLDQAEQQVAEAVAQALADVADEFAAELLTATEIVAARFSVSRIARMWRSRVTRIVRSLLGVAETAAADAADSVGAELPPGWDDLPGRHDDGRPLPRTLGDYVTVTEYLLNAVGERLAAAAARDLAAGVDAGEDVDQLRARLRATFAREGAQLGDGREERIARTEATRAWNTAVEAAGRDLTGPDRPLVKQWVARRDGRARAAHKEADGQIQLLGEPFTVGGFHLARPGDPTAPPGLTVNCRCRIALAPDPARHRASAFDPQVTPRVAFSERRETDVEPSVTAAADGSHLQGAVIALMPSAADAERIALPGGEVSDELHLTLVFLGKGADWDAGQRAELVDNVRSAAADLLNGPIVGAAFGVNHWNPYGATPSWVWAVGDDRERPDGAPVLADAHDAAVLALEGTHDRPAVPVQHSPWVPHVCAAYSDEGWPLQEMADRLGPITFTRLRVAFAGEHTDIPLGPPEEDAPMSDTHDTTAAGVETRSWSTPGDTGLAFENEQTGDGRVFAKNSLYWSDGPWPLQYADEMLMGHEGAELIGSIQEMTRGGDRIGGIGVLYPSRDAGADAVMLLEEGAPLGVSVDLDDVAVEFVDRTYNPADQQLAEDDSWYSLAASFAAMSLLHLEDGSWMVTARTAPEWTASGTVLARAQQTVQLITGPDGRVTADAARSLIDRAGKLTAAAGDPDSTDGLVIHSETSGDFLMRITRARVRGATLVAMPAYNRARIVLDPMEEPRASAAPVEEQTASADGTHDQVVAYVRSSPVPLGAREVAKTLGLLMVTAQRHLSRAAETGRLVRLARGLYVGPTNHPEGPDATASGEPEDELVASMWTTMRSAPPMPAAWFKEPTGAELPPGSGGVHYADGRIYGWVAQAGEPHAGIPGKKVTIESLGEIDLTHFLRAKFAVDDGSTVRAGAMTMNVGHHRDGAECETAACQWDDTRTVAGIVTVGMNSRGMWFSGAAAPHLSDWDRSVFQACQPSYHLRQAQRGGKWQLRAVLSVPVPGHSSPLVASVIERSNMALAASAAFAQTLSGQRPDIPADVSKVVSAIAEDVGLDLSRGLDGHRPDTTSGRAPDTLSGQVSEVIASLLTDGAFLDRIADAIDQRAQARTEVEELSAAITPARRETDAGLAGTTTKGL
ncbi:phage minor head protein [Kitasatospora sp. NPDC058046]|uniref:phage minor head protein n=1 Tax=Kitasatospora sp. NPDC058046 TaxID=3346312 RepID=UPI0036D86280